MEDAPVYCRPRTQMVSQNRMVANDGTDNDDVDGYASEINREVRAWSSSGNSIFTRDREDAPADLRRVMRFAM